MKDTNKTKKQLINELAALRQRIAELEAVDTECKQAEEVLQKSETFLDSIIEQSPYAMWISDDQGTLIRLNNAIQAMPEGGQLLVETSVVSENSSQSGWVAISIADTGVGIPKENLDKLFEPLFTTKTRGIGLGLALVKNLIEGNGGIIEVESDGVPGRGSTFIVRLPIREAEVT
jgi:C4-dicarboxylate-specific signal transduction histidine kinase